MYLDEDELHELGLEMNPAALDDLIEAERCAICLVPPAPRGINNAEAMYLWIERHARFVGRSDRSSGSAPADPIDLVPMNERLAQPRIAIQNAQVGSLEQDTQLRPTIGVPAHLLRPILRGGLSDDQLECLQQDFVFAICDVCRYSDLAYHEKAEWILERYITAKCDDSRGVFHVDPHRPYVEEIIQLIAREVEVQRRSA
jgi:hypothetical protein